MKFLFVHDHILKKIGDEYYSTGSLSNNIMHRYLYNDNDTITLYTRKTLGDSSEIDKLALISDKKVICKPSNIYHSPKDFLYKKKEY